MRVAGVRRWATAVGFAGGALFLGAPDRVEAMPVFDASVFAQQLVTAIEAADQTVGQIEAYKLQILQYQQMFRDGAADIVYTWDRLESLHRRLTNLDQELAGFVDDMGDWVQNLQTREYYRTSPCYGSDLKCYREQWRQVMEGYRHMQFATTESQRRTLEIFYKNIELEREKIKETSRNLKQVQRYAERADGQWKAQQASNMLLANLSSHLEAMRQMMMVYYGMIAAQQAAELERRAQQEAAREHFFRPMAKRSPVQRLQVWP